MNTKTIACHPANYGGSRGAVEWIVVHYTAGDGDTAEDNARYFAANPVGCSAHWFVDETETVLSVPETHTAWHCGAKIYLHPHCRNENSVGVELCSRRDDRGNYFFMPAVLENGQALVRRLMKQYGLPPERVLRHYDVTGKNCPAPLTDAGQWKEFREAIMRYDTLESLPAWGMPTGEKLTELGFLQGDGSSLDLSHDMLRLLVVLDRAGVFGDRPDTEEKSRKDPE